MQILETLEGNFGLKVAALVSECSSRTIHSFPDAPAAVVSLEGSPLPFTNQTLRIIAEQGNPGLTLICSSDGSPPPSHTWQKLNGMKDTAWSVVNGELGLAIVWNRPLVYEDSGYYLCNANNSIGESTVKVYLLVKSKYVHTYIIGTCVHIYNVQT